MLSKDRLGLKHLAMNGFIFQTKPRNTIQFKKPLSATKTTPNTYKNLLFNKLKVNLTTIHRNY